MSLLHKTVPRDTRQGNTRPRTQIQSLETELYLILTHTRPFFSIIQDRVLAKNARYE